MVARRPQIAYTASDFDDDEIFVVDADGGGPRQITDNTSNDVVWHWSLVAPAPPARGAFAARISRRAVRLRHGRIAMRLRCPAAAQVPCRGRLTLRRKKVALGSKAFRIAAGRRATVKVRLSRRGHRIVRRTAPTRIAAVVRATGLPTRKVTFLVRSLQRKG